MKERPILFSAPMIRAILAGNKTQTRRKFVDTVLPDSLKSYGMEEFRIIDGIVHGRSPESQDFKIMVGGMGKGGKGNPVRCPYGQPGDRLWVRETCRAEELESGLDGVRYLADDFFSPIENSEAAAEKWGELACYGMKKSGRPECRTVPSIHMPRWASRIDLEITAVSVERLQDISEADAMAEGTPCYVCGSALDGRSESDCHCFHRKATPIDYRYLWESINGSGSWAANPWVWAIEFRRVK